MAQAKRPIAEPPILDYTALIRPASLQDLALAEKAGLVKLQYMNVATLMAIRDANDEDWLLIEYFRHLLTVSGGTEEESAVEETFYRDLRREVMEDQQQVRKEKARSVADAFYENSELKRWEHAYLDADGGTTWIQLKLKEGWSIFWNDEIRVKYEHLLPEGNKDDFPADEELPSTTKLALNWPQISKPPDFNYVYFSDDVLPSDLRFGKLFPGSLPQDYMNGFTYRDYKTEKELLEMYISSMAEAQEKDPASASFYEGLLAELRRDFKKASDNDQKLYQLAGNLEKWESTFSDQDGKTEGGAEDIER